MADVAPMKTQNIGCKMINLSSTQHKDEINEQYSLRRLLRQFNVNNFRYFSEINRKLKIIEVNS